MTAVRGRGEGSIRRRKTGGYEVRISSGVAAGKRRRISLYAKTKVEAVALLASARHQQKAGGIRGPRGTDTVAAFLTRWLETHVAKTKRGATFSNHEQNVRLHINPALGNRLLTDIRPGDVDTLLDNVTSTKSTATGGSLRHNVRMTMGAAWAWAVKSQRIPGVENVVAMTYARPLESREPTWLDPEQIRVFVNAVKGNPNEAFYLVAVYCGLRYSELRGLRWRDLELRGSRLQLRVVKQLDQRGLRDVKTKKSRRVIALNRAVVSALEAHRKQQQVEQQQAIEDGALWLDQHGGLVFTGQLGTGIGGTGLRQQFARLLQDAGLPLIRLHDLRHSCASYLLAKGVPIHMVSALLGHSQVSTTLNIYAHCIPAQQDDAVAAAWAAL